MRVGLVGCGFTADLYTQGIKSYPNLKLVGATDSNGQRCLEYCQYHSVKSYSTLQSLLDNSDVEMIVNLTTSASHFEVTKMCLEAGKHVFSEKPLSLDFDEAQELVNLANSKGLYLSSAPDSLLGETAQTLWGALRKNEIGTVRVIYAELEDGPLHLNEPHTWRSPSGAPYDYKAEFSSGVTAEHACYYISWLTAFFGPAVTVNGFSKCLWPDRQVSKQEMIYATTPDFAVAVITFESGVIARFTCGLVAPYNHVLKIVGDTGVLTVNECWNVHAPVFLERYSQFKFKAERYPITRRLPFLANLRDHNLKIYPPVRRSSWKQRNRRFALDYGRGISELARAIVEKRRSRLPPDFCLHVNEISLAVQNSDGTPYQVKTRFEPLQPAKDEESMNSSSANLSLA